MDGGAISEKPLPRSQNTYCDCNILVVPPCFHPTGRVHSPGTFHLSTKDPTRFPIHPGGIIIPLQPSLRSQISEVARYFTFPSTEGLSLHADVSVHESFQSLRRVGNNGVDMPLPMISAASWGSLMFGCKEHGAVAQTAWAGPSRSSGLGVAVQLEFRIDYHTASWYEAWLMSKFCPSAPTTGNLDPSLKVHRRCSETDSSYCGRLSHSTAPTSIPASPLPPVRTPENQLKPSPILPDGLTGPVRSRSIYLLSQKRQYRRFHPTEHRGEHKNTLLPLSRNRKKSQDSDLFTTPPSSEPESRSSKPHHQRSIPTISYHDAHPTSTEKITPRDKIPQGRRNSIDADFMPGVLEKEIKMICKHNSRDPVCNHPRIRDSYFPFEVDDPQQSVKDKTYSTSEKISMDPENDAIISEDTCIYRGTDDKRSPKLDLVSDWKKFLVQMTPPSVGSSREVGGDYVGNKHMCGRKRPVPQPLNLVPVETSEPLPVISPELSLASSTSSSLRIRETKRTPDLELKTIREEPHNSEIYPEDKISISSSSPTSFVNTLPPSVIRNLVGRSKMPWRRSRTNESLRSDSVKVRSTFQDDALNNLNGLYSANDTPRNGKSFSSPAYTTPDSNSSSDSFSIGDLSHSLLDLPLESPAPRRDRPLVRVSGPPKAREVKRQSKLMDPDAARFPASWHMKCIHLQSFLPISLTRHASISSFTSQTVIQKAKKVGILNNSTSRLTTLTPPASSKSTK